MTVRNFRSPIWWQAWLVNIPLLLSIPLISMSFNDAVLPRTIAAMVLLMAVVGFGLALLPDDLAARSPMSLAWLTTDGLGLALFLLTLPYLDFFHCGLIQAKTGFLRWLSA